MLAAFVLVKKISLIAEQQFGLSYPHYHSECPYYTGDTSIILKKEN